MSGSSVERSSLFLTSGVSPPQPSAGSCTQNKKICVVKKGRDKHGGFVRGPVNRTTLKRRKSVQEKGGGK